MGLEVVDWRGELYLIHEHYTGDFRHVFDVPLLRLFSNEEQLREGRFAHYVELPQPEHIHVTRTGRPTSDEVQQHFGAMVEWLATHATSPWSFEVVMQSAQELFYDFSFADEVLAFTFAMLWM